MRGKLKSVKVVPLPKLLKRTEEVFNRWVRNRDADDPCISCGEHKENYDAGHFVPVKGGSFLRFHEWNVNKECKSCNGFDGFHLVGYRKNLIKKIGVEKVEWLEANRRTVKKWEREELEYLITKYK